MSTSPGEGDTLRPVPENVERLPSIVYGVPPQLDAISAEEAATRPGPNGWSPKEELGHLIDSATVNHQRIVRTILEDRPALYGYDGDRWVELHQYQDSDWLMLIETWQTMNDHLLTALEEAGAATWARTCTIGGGKPVTLAYLVDDYVEHMIGHLRHIGIDVDDLSPAAAAVPGTVYPEKPAQTDYPINNLMEHRWSPRLFEDQRVERETVMTLLEAARWAPSCFGEQPWRYLVFDGSEPAAMARARDCLAEGNAWARKAPVLMISVACESFSRNGTPNRWAQHDVGLASENLVLMAVELGLAAHQMAGFDADRARAEFGIPEGFTPMAMIAIGYPYRGSLDDLEEKTRRKELAPRSRRSIGEIGFDGNWGAPYDGK